LGTNPLSLHKTQLSNVNSEQEPELVAWFSLNFWLNFFHTPKIIPMLFEGNWNVFCWCC
jgi:hypothetical protein